MKFLHENQGICTPHQAYQTRGPMPEDQPSKHLVLKSNKVYVQENHGAIGNSNPTLKKPTWRITHPVTQLLKATVWEEPRQYMKEIQFLNQGIYQKSTGILYGNATAGGPHFYRILWLTLLVGIIFALSLPPTHATQGIPWEPSRAGSPHGGHPPWMSSSGAQRRLYFWDIYTRPLLQN